MLKIRGNDLELNDKKVARLFDLNTFDRRDLEDLFDKANNYKDKKRLINFTSPLNNQL